MVPPPPTSNAAELGGLERGVALVHDGANLGHVFSVRVVGATFAARAGELVEHHAATQVGGIFVSKALA